MIEKMAMIGAIVLPLWNFPLIMHIVKRKSADDISLPWALGVWVCILLMFPSGMNSADFVWRIYNYINVVCFTLVVAVVLYYRSKSKKK